MLIIAAFLDVKDFSSLAQTTAMIYQLLKQPLYRLALSSNYQSSTTYFFAAVKSGHVSAVQLFIDAGASVNVKDRMGWTPLHRCSINGNEPMTRLLIDNGADVSAIGCFGATPLHKALHSKQDSIARCLLRAGADIWATDVWGRTPLHEAAANGNSDVVQLLLEAGADYAAKDYGGRTPCDVARRQYLRATAVARWAARPGIYL